MDELKRCEVKKYYLDFAKTYPYFIQQILWKQLSKKIVDKVPLTHGKFYTILPENAFIEKMYEFSAGWIIPPKPTGEIDSTIEGVKFNVHRVKTLREELCHFFHAFLKKSNENKVIIEFTSGDYLTKNIDIKGVKTIFFKDEVYFILDHKSSFDSIELAVNKGCDDWHALIVLLNKSSELPVNLNDQDLENICSNVFQVVTTAYDGESYLFWEKNS